MQTSRRALDRLLDPQEYQRDAAHPTNAPPLSLVSPLSLVDNSVWNWYKANPGRRSLLVEAYHSPRPVLEIVHESVGSLLGSAP